MFPCHNKRPETGQQQKLNTLTVLEARSFRRKQSWFFLRATREGKVSLCVDGYLLPVSTHDILPMHTSESKFPLLMRTSVIRFSAHLTP